jgi:hypothetical protein
VKTATKGQPDRKKAGTELPKEKMMKSSVVDDKRKESSIKAKAPTPKGK